MSVAWIRANSDDLVRCIDRRPYDWPVEIEDRRSWLAPVFVGSAAAGTGLDWLFRRGTGGWPMDLGDVLGMGLLCLRVHHSGNVRRRCTLLGCWSDPSQSNRGSFYRRKRPRFILLLSDLFRLI